MVSMVIIIIAGFIAVCGFVAMLYALLCANNLHRDINQEWEEHKKYMNELSLKRQKQNKR